MKKLILLSTITLCLLCSCTSDSFEPSTGKEITEQKVTETIDLHIAPDPYTSVPRIVDQLPFFGGTSTKSESDQALIQHIYKNLEYPEEAQNSKTEGKVYVQFIVEKDGSISNIHIPRGIGSGCDIAAAEVVASINHLEERWSTPIHNGQASRVLYTLPISFVLYKDKQVFKLFNY